MALPKNRHEVLRHQERAQHVRVEDPAVVLHRGGLQGAEHPYAGVVDERIRTGRPGVLREGPHARAVGHVEGDEVDARQPQLRCLASTGEHLGARGLQHLGDGVPDAAARARHGDDAPGKREDTRVVHGVPGDPWTPHPLTCAKATGLSSRSTTTKSVSGTSASVQAALPVGRVTAYCT